jgi:arabinose-5-phosphate isomerase
MIKFDHCNEINLLEWGAASILQEADGLKFLAVSLDKNFANAVQLILSCAGRVVVSGIGKSGHVGKKIAATFASTGTPSFFVHPAEASHGDLGMISKRDIVIALSKSGESPEFADIINYCHRFEIPLIAITAVATSSLAKAATHLLLLPQVPEACPMGLAPTTSTTMTLALGDALAVACIKARDFKPENFKIFHPGGKLGQKLVRVRDVMHSGDELPLLNPDSTVSEAVLEMSKGRFGCVGIVDDSGSLVGIFTDGDLRRHFKAENLELKMKDLMSTDPQQLDPEILVADVVSIFSRQRIPSAFVCESGKPIGLIHIHDLFQRGFL